MTDPNNPTAAFISALSHAAVEAVSAGLLLRLALKGGEVIEGIPLAVGVDVEDVPPRGTPPSELHLYGAREETIRIADSEILLEEVASFTIRLP
jgi:hypothetical protein